jgi:hypothetical protein
VSGVHTHMHAWHQGAHPCVLLSTNVIPGILAGGLRRPAIVQMQGSFHYRPHTSFHSLAPALPTQKFGFCQLISRRHFLLGSRRLVTLQLGPGMGREQGLAAAACFLSIALHGCVRHALNLTRRRSAACNTAPIPLAVAVPPRNQCR